MNPVEIVALDALDLLVVVDNESDTLSSADKGVPQLAELGRLVARVPHRAPIDGHERARTSATSSGAKGGPAMKEEQNQFLRLLGQIPGRLTAEQTAWVLNCQPYDIPILVAACSSPWAILSRTA
jgi:hypothetical protein